MSNVTVVMCTYNGEAFLGQQLASIAGQTLQPAELVVCDDGSTDRTLEILEAFGRTARFPVRIERNAERLGYSDNFMKAAGLAQTQYIAFCDQDDIWYPAKLEKSRDCLQRSGAVLTAHVVESIDREGRTGAAHRFEITENASFPPCTLDPWGMFLGFTEMFDRRLLDIIPAERRGMDNNTFAKILPHDRWLYFLASHFGTIAVVNEVLAGYRQHGGNTYGVTPKTMGDRFRTKVAEGPARLKQFAELAGYRVQMLKDARSPALAAEFDAAIARWQRIHDHCRRRYTLYMGRTLVGRAARLVGNMVAGTYRPIARDGLGSKRLLEDASLGLFGRLAYPGLPQWKA